jgi:hypothetical protein
MGNKRSRPGSKGSSPQGDDFRAINGVSTAVESRLHRAGILTYAQFASLSPEDIITIVGNISGLTVEKIIKQNWISHARELALRVTLEDTIEDETLDDNDQHHEKFVVDILMRPDKRITHTRVTHTQTGDVEEWGGWHEQRLIKFLSRQANLPDLEMQSTEDENLLREPPVAKTESEPKANLEETIEPSPPEALTPGATIDQEPAAGEIVSKAKTIEPPPPEALTAGATIDQEPAAGEIVSKAKSFQERRQPPSRVAEDVQSHKFEVLTIDPGPSSRLLSHKQPFDVRMTLDLTNLDASREKPLIYQAVFHARSLSGGSTQTFQRVNGKIEQSERPVIVLKGIYLIPGSYTLDAAVNIKMPGKAPITTGALKIHLSGGVLQVY